jgi:hypothetical protein
VIPLDHRAWLSMDRTNCVKRAEVSEDDVVQRLSPNRGRQYVQVHFTLICSGRVAGNTRQSSLVFSLRRIDYQNRRVRRLIVRLNSVRLVVKGDAIEFPRKLNRQTSPINQTKHADTVILTHLPWLAYWRNFRCNQT